jgi:hypothetical protein
MNPSVHRPSVGRRKGALADAAMLSASDQGLRVE